MRFTGKSPSAARPADGGLALYPAITLAELAVRIRQRKALVTRLSSFLARSGPVAGPTDPDAVPGSGPRPPPFATLRPCHGPRRARALESAALRRSGASYIAGIPIIRPKNSRPPRIRLFPSPRAT